MSAATDREAERKAFATLRAALALRGYALHRSDPHDGEVVFVATRWGHARELKTLAAVVQFAGQVGAAL